MSAVGRSVVRQIDGAFVLPRTRDPGIFGCEMREGSLAHGLLNRARSMTTAHSRSRSRSRSRGVTPIAAALAVLVLGAGASCLWWIGSAGAARDGKSSSQADAAQIYSAARAFRVQHADGCPTFSSLQQEELLSRNARSDDAWGNRFRISCAGGELSVSSVGPDGKPSTSDDISATR